LGKAYTYLRMSGRTVFACLGLVFVMGSLPLYFSARTPNMQKRDGALSTTQTMRGPYMNTGSRDAGRDDQWQAKYKPADSVG